MNKTVYEFVNYLNSFKGRNTIADKITDGSPGYEMICKLRNGGTYLDMFISMMSNFYGENIKYKRPCSDCNAIVFYVEK